MTSELNRDVASRQRGKCQTLSETLECLRISRLTKWKEILRRVATYIFSFDCKIRSRSEFVIFRPRERLSSHSTPIWRRWDWRAAQFYKEENDKFSDKVSRLKFPLLWFFTRFPCKPPHVANWASCCGLKVNSFVFRHLKRNAFRFIIKATWILNATRWKPCDKNIKWWTRRYRLIILRAGFRWPFKLIGGAVIEACDYHDISYYRSNQLKETRVLIMIEENRYNLENKLWVSKA